MSRVITFSRFFPSYHPRKGEPTFFVEKIWNSFRGIDFSLPDNFKEGVDNYTYGMNGHQYLEAMHIRETKHHTIRAGNRWKVGDKFSPRVWSGKPYQSKQITIAPDIEIKKICNIDLDIRGDFKEFSFVTDVVNHVALKDVASNDGLDLNDFLNWFSKPGKFQILCWNELVNY